MTPDTAARRRAEETLESEVLSENTRQLANDVLALLSELATARQQTSEMSWPTDVRQFSVAVRLLERALDALDPDSYLELCADIQRFLRDE